MLPLWWYRHMFSIQTAVKWSWFSLHYPISQSIKWISSKEKFIVNILDITTYTQTYMRVLVRACARAHTHTHTHTHPPTHTHTSFSDVVSHFMFLFWQSVFSGMHVIFIPYSLMKVDPASWMKMVTKFKGVNLTLYGFLVTVTLRSKFFMLVSLLRVTGWGGLKMQWLWHAS